MVKKVAGTILVILYTFAVSGCATIAHGTVTTVRLNSTPQGATAMVGGSMVVTPSSIALKNTQAYPIVFKKDGYEDTYYTIDKYMSGWVWGNIVFGGLIGLVIDNMTGGAYKLVPQEVNVNLSPKK